jgi:capsid protein
MSRIRQSALARANARSMARRRVVVSGGFFGGGGYEGARTDRSALRNWTPGASSADAEIIPALEGLRGRTRDLARNAPLIAGALDTHLTSIIGPGLVPHPRIDHEFLGLTEEQADTWQKQAARIWWLLAESKRLDVKQRLSFAQQTWVVLRSWFTDGDHFFSAPIRRAA